MTLSVKYFRGIKFLASDAVYFEPNPVVGLLDENIEALRGLGSVTVVDVGSGVGNIAVYLAQQLPDAKVIAIEPHDASYDLMKQNIDMHGLKSRIKAIHAPVAQVELPRDSVDAVLGNIPNWPIQPNDNYIPFARFAGPDGMDVIKDTIRFSDKVLRSGGFMQVTRFALPGDQPETWFNLLNWENISAPENHYVKAYKK